MVVETFRDNGVEPLPSQTNFVFADIGRNGYVMVEDSSALDRAFEAISETIIGYTKRFYLLSYCSPARAGVHTVTIEANHTEASGDLSYEFDAEGFGPRCNPEKPPPFDTGKNVNRRLPTPERGTRIEIGTDESGAATVSGGASASGEASVE